MIQRIQTIYLLVAGVLMGLTLLLPLAWFGGDAGSFELRAFALKSLVGSLHHATWYMGVLQAVSCLLPLVTIFLYRRRLLQIRLCAVAMVLMVGVVVMEAIYYFLSVRLFADFAFHTQGFRPAIALPLVSLFFMYLAARAIFRDELMVRAADRIR